MRLSWKAALAWLVLAATVPAAGCGRGAQREGVLARVGSVEITVDDMESRIKQMPSFARQEFDGAEGRKRLLDRMIQEEMMYQAALDASVMNDPLVAMELRETRRRILIDSYYRQRVEARAQLDEAGIEAYYRAHPDEFTDPEQVRVRHIQVPAEAEARRLRTRLVSGGADFAELAKARSKDDRTAAQGGLVPGMVAQGRPFGSMGNMPELAEAALALAPGQVSEPVKSSRGWHLLRVEERRPVRPRPLDEVRDVIQAKGSPERVSKAFEETMAELRAHYRVQEYPEAVEQARKPSSEELFQLAQQSHGPEERVQIYERILREHPDEPRCFEAQFMIGFVLAEDLKDFPRAKEAFQKVLEAYPTCDLAESARWMLANMGKEFPAFEATEGTAGAPHGS